MTSSISIVIGLVFPEVLIYIYKYHWFSVPHDVYCCFFTVKSIVETIIYAIGESSKT